MVIYGCVDETCHGVLTFLVKNGILWISLGWTAMSEWSRGTPMAYMDDQWIYFHKKLFPSTFIFFTVISVCGPCSEFVFICSKNKNDILVVLPQLIKSPYKTLERQICGHLWLRWWNLPWGVDFPCEKWYIMDISRLDRHVGMKPGDSYGIHGWPMDIFS